ncbi:MAG: DNA-binding response regulator [Ferruginibacter sp.]|nr:DNA-binding response regulator [Ferruginibacter sp.]
MKLRCLLIDDEAPALKVLESHIAHISSLEIVGQCSNAIEAVELLHQHTVDVLFLDIKMPKMIGTQFLRNLSHPPSVIFVTAFRDYAVDAYELDAVDYLVKPVSFERFFKAISRLQKTLGADLPAPENKGEHKQDAFVYLKVGSNMQKVFVHNIMYIESWKDYVKVFLADQKYLLVKQTISAMENLLSVYQFLRVHRSFIISLRNVSGYNNNAVQLLHKKEIPIGRLYKQVVMERISG